MLNKRNQIQKGLICKAFWKNFKNRNQSSGCQGWGGGRVLTTKDTGNFLGQWRCVS